MVNFQDIFNAYTINGTKFYLMNKDIVYPDDKNLDIYGSVLIPDDTPWTVLSYKIYGTINFWWLLAGINRHQFKKNESSVFYAPAGMNCYYIKKSYINNFFTPISE